MPSFSHLMLFNNPYRKLLNSWKEVIKNSYPQTAKSAKLPWNTAPNLCCFPHNDDWLVIQLRKHAPTHASRGHLKPRSHIPHCCARTWAPRFVCHIGNCQRCFNWKTHPSEGQWCRPPLKPKCSSNHVGGNSAPRIYAFHWLGSGSEIEVPETVGLVGVHNHYGNPLAQLLHNPLPNRIRLSLRILQRQAYKGIGEI